jgi:hypothetical protein
MPLGDEELRTEDRAGAPGPAAAPAVIEANVVAEGPGVIEATVVAEEPGVDPTVADGPGFAGAGALPDEADVPLWGPPSGGRSVARWHDAAPADGDSPASTAVEPAPLAPASDERRHRTPALIGVALVGAVLLAGLVAVTAWPGTDTTGSLANQFGPGKPGATDGNGRPVDLPPSQPATPVSFAPGGDVVRPEPRRARIIDPQSGREVIVDLPPGTTVDTTTGQVVVRVTGTPTTVRTTTTRPATTTTTVGTTTTTEDTTTTTEQTTTSTVEETTTTETVPTIPEPVP